MKKKITLSIRNEQDFGQNITDLLEYSTEAFYIKRMSNIIFFTLMRIIMEPGPI